MITTTKETVNGTGTVRGIYLDDADYADLKLFMATDRRSLSFLVRDAITLYLGSRRDELQRLKEIKKSEEAEGAA